MNDGRDRMHYIRFWNALFGNVLGWTAEDVLDWANKWRGFNDAASMFDHESPAYYATVVFTRKAIDSLGRSFVEANRIEERIRRHLTGIERDFSSGAAIDWTAASAQIHHLVAGAEE